MIIPKIDQQLAAIKATDVQFSNGYHLSENDYKQFTDAVTHVNFLLNKINEQRRKDGKHVDRV